MHERGVQTRKGRTQQQICVDGNDNELGAHLSAGIKRLSHNLGKVAVDHSRNNKNQLTLLMFKEQY